MYALRVVVIANELAFEVNYEMKNSITCCATLVLLAMFFVGCGRSADNLGVKTETGEPVRLAQQITSGKEKGENENMKASVRRHTENRSRLCQWPDREPKLQGSLYEIRPCRDCKGRL